MSGKWQRQSEIADRMLRVNKMLEATDVGVQRQNASCLGTAVSLEIDAVRLLLVGREPEAISYFRALSELASAAIELNETWIYADADFARCEALRLRTVATWVLGDEKYQTVASEAASEWLQLSRNYQQASTDYTKRNAEVVSALITAQRGYLPEVPALKVQPSPRNPGSGWELLLAALAELQKPSAQARWEQLLAEWVVSTAHDQLIGPTFNVGEACLIAGVAARLRSQEIRPIDAIMALRRSEDPDE